MNSNDEAKIHNAMVAIRVCALLRLFVDRPMYDNDEITFQKMIDKEMNDIQIPNTGALLRIYELLRTHLGIRKMLINSSLSWSDIYNLLKNGNIQ